MVTTVSDLPLSTKPHVTGASSCVAGVTFYTKVVEPNIPTGSCEPNVPTPVVTK